MVPQLGLWERLDLAHGALCAHGGPGAFESRQAKCHRTRRKKGAVRGYRTERGAWRWGGLVQCDLWACPSCGTRRARSTAATLGVAIDRWLRRSEYTDVWMLTLTAPHRAEDLVGVTIERLYAAHAAFLKSPQWRAFVERWSVASTVRVLDVTFGGRNGAHPHFHVALFPSHAVDIAREDGMLLSTAHKARSDRDDRARRCDEIALDLWGAWESALRGAGVTRAVAGEAVKLSPAEKARSYFTAWGLADEVGATPAKARSHLRLLDAAGAGVAGAGAAYVEWCAAVHGRQWVTGLADLRSRLSISDEDVETYVAELRVKRDAALEAAGTPVQLVRPLSIVIPELLYPAALSLGWARVTAILDGADAGGLVEPQMALVDALRAESLRLDMLRIRRIAGRDPPPAPS